MGQMRFTYLAEDQGPINQEVCGGLWTDTEKVLSKIDISIFVNIKYGSALQFDYN